MIVLGIVGGVASGKSFIAEQFAERGAARIDADRVGHEVLREAAVKEQIRSRWGGSVFGGDGEVDRSRIARIVFAENAEAAAELAYLEQLTHPRIRERMRAEIDQLPAEVPVVVLDAALLMEAGWDHLCDRIIFVDATYAQRLSRVQARGWNAAELDAREAAQLDLQSKQQRATWTIDNRGAAADTIRQINTLWEQLLSLSPTAHLP